MKTLYHRLMARFYLKWNPKGFQKHVRALKDQLAENFYYMVRNAPPEIIDETKSFQAKIEITRKIYYVVSVNIAEVQQLIKENESRD